MSGGAIRDHWAICRHPVLHGLLCHSTTMSYDSKIGCLLLQLALFYHINDCGLIVGTWSAASRQGSKSRHDYMQGFYISMLSILLFLFNEIIATFLFFPTPFYLLSSNLPGRTVSLCDKTSQNAGFFSHYLKGHLRGVTDICVGRHCWFLLAHHSSPNRCGLCDWPMFLLIQPAHPPQRASLRAV